MPERIRLRRTPGWKLPEGAVSVARPSNFGNPFKPPVVHRVIQGDVPPAVLRRQRHPRQGAHRPAGAQHPLGRTGAPCRDCSRWVSPARRPHPTCTSPRIGRSTCLAR